MENITKKHLISFSGHSEFTDDNIVIMIILILKTQIRRLLIKIIKTTKYNINKHKNNKIQETTILSITVKLLLLIKIIK